DIFLGPVAQRTLQEPTDIVKAALRMPSIIVAQVGSKEPTNLTRITAIEIPRPSDQGFANRRFVRPAGLSHCRPYQRHQPQRRESGTLRHVLVSLMSCGFGDGCRLECLRQPACK